MIPTWRKMGKTKRHDSGLSLVTLCLAWASHSRSGVPDGKPPWPQIDSSEHDVVGVLDVSLRQASWKVGGKSSTSFIHLLISHHCAYTGATHGGKRAPMLIRTSAVGPIM